MIATIARILSVAVLVYMFVCIARIFMSWIPQLDSGAAGRIIRSLSEPYLALFRRIKALSAGALDFSPIVAIAVLAVANDLLTRIAVSLGISLGLVLGLIVSAAWSALAFFLSFFAVCALARLVAYAARWNSLHPLWRVVDAMLNPVLYRINRVLYRGRFVTYLQGLITGLVILLALYFLGRIFIGLVVALLFRLPL